MPTTITDNWVNMDYVGPYDHPVTYNGNDKRDYTHGRLQQKSSGPILVHPDDVEKLARSGHFRKSTKGQQTQPVKHALASPAVSSALEEKVGADNPSDDLPEPPAQADRNTDRIGRKNR